MILVPTAGKDDLSSPAPSVNRVKEPRLCGERKAGDVFYTMFFLIPGQQVLIGREYIVEQLCGFDKIMHTVIEMRWVLFVPKDGRYVIGPAVRDYLKQLCSVL